MPATVSCKEAVSYSHPSRLNLFSSRILFFKPVIPLSQSSYFGFTDLPQSFLLSLDFGPGSLSDMVLCFVVCSVAASGLNIAFHLITSRSRIFTFDFRCGSPVIYHLACTLPISFLRVMLMLPRCICSVVSCFYSDIPRSMSASCLLLLTYFSYPPCFLVSMPLQNLLCLAQLGNACSLHASWTFNHPFSCSH
ncbi:hypothetical protein F5051DRAFT_143697 [Lentinula edodes]|nr:hypothetical protein F5051DRAFT_143697 [Lentinula edodes]